MTEPTSPAQPSPAAAESTVDEVPATPAPTGQGFPGQQQPGQPYPSQPQPGQPFPNQPYPNQPYPGQPFPNQVGPGQPYGPWAPPGPGAPPAKKRRTTLIVSIVLVVVVLLCGGVATTAYVVTNRQTGHGASTPTAAATGFLTAVYTRQNATAAEKYVCKAADDATAIKRRVNQVSAATKTLNNPTFSWDTPTVSGQTKTIATVTTNLHLTTADEKSSVQKISIVTTESHGWWVCDVKTATK